MCCICTEGLGTYSLLPHMWLICFPERKSMYGHCFLKFFVDT